MDTESVRTITEIIDVETGELLHIDNAFFRQNEAHLFLLRRRLYEYAYLKIGQPKYVCAVCQQPVVLLGKKTKRAQVAYFAHYKDSDDCPIKTHGRELTAEEINCLRYKGGESDYHLELKHHIFCALQTSHINNIEFSHIKEEKRIASKLDFRSWAVPDVYAECGDLKINFEVQLSTLFLSTIIERDVYYRFHGIFIIWIFAPGAINNDTISQKDIIWANNGNIFIYDQKARELTEQTEELTLLCRWYEFANNDSDAVRLTGGKYLTLSELTFDRESNTVYYVDVASDIEKRCPNFKKDRAEMEQMELESLDEFRVLLDGTIPTKEEVIEGIRSNLYKPRWIKKGSHFGYAKYGHTIIPFIYNHAEEFVDELAIIRRNRKYGVVNVLGEEVVEPKYQECRNFHEGLAAVKLNYKWGFVNKKGYMVIAPIYYDIIQDFQDGYAVVKRGYRDRGLHIDKIGRCLIQNGKNAISVPAIYDEYRDFSEGLAAVKLNDKWGFINLKGEEVVGPQYDTVNDFINGYASVAINPSKQHWNFANKWGFVNSHGQEVIKPIYRRIVRHFHEGYAVVEEDHNSNSVLIDTQGRAVVKNGEEYIAIPAIYDKCRDFSEGLAAVKLNGKWGFIDIKGNEVVAPQYDNCLEFSEGLAAVKLNGKWGFINVDGEEVVSPSFCEVVQNFQGGCAIVKKDYFHSKGILIDTQGRAVVKNGEEYIAIPAIYDKCRDFSEGLAAVKLNGKWGFIDAKGNEIVTPQYDSVDNFKRGFARVSLKMQYGVINNQGKNITPIIYDCIDEFNNGCAQAYKKGIIGFIRVDSINSTHTWIESSSIWEFFITTRMLIKVTVNIVKENGYECSCLDFLQRTRGRMLFIPNSLVAKNLCKGEDVNIYIVKDPGKNKSIIASTYLLPIHYNVGEKCQGRIVRIENYGIFVKLLNSNITALAHISTFKHANDMKNYNTGDAVKVEVIAKDDARQRISIKIVK